MTLREPADWFVCSRWDMMVFFMCHCLAWFIADYIQLTGVQVSESVLKETGCALIG